ncbi:hypothetical protein GCM10027266_06870 [Arenimonas alkanexedens]
MTGVAPGGPAIASSVVTGKGGAGVAATTAGTSKANSTASMRKLRKSREKALSMVPPVHATPGAWTPENRVLA